MPASPAGIEVRAYAKINLSLDIVGRREDGFHELRSVMQTVSLHDTLRFFRPEVVTPAAAPEQDLSLIDRAVDAVRLLPAATCSIAETGRISYSVEKRIPSAAGLGGGSSDCAAAIRSATLLLGLEPDDAATMSVAASLGSDVPFFLTSGTAVAGGRGERITALDDAPRQSFLLANGGHPVSTAAVFRALESRDRGDGHATDRVLKSLSRGEVTFGGNDLTAAALRVCPEIQRTFEVLERVAAPDRIALSGSGGTVVAVFEDEEVAERARDTIGGLLPFVQLSYSIPRSVALREPTFSGN